MKSAIKRMEDAMANQVNKMLDWLHDETKRWDPEPGDVLLIDVLAGHSYLGRFKRVEIGVFRDVRLVMDNVIRIHGAGIWDEFTAGRLEGGGRQAALSAEPPEAEVQFPAQICIPRLWPGDLKAAQAWAKRTA